MTVFTATLNQTAFLFLFIVAGYVLSRLKFVPGNAHTVLSKLENTIFIPGALGKDTRVASGMALVSHILSCITIPMILTLFDLL